MQDAMWALMMFTVFAMAATIVYNNVSRFKQVGRTRLWPTVEATIESGKLEIVRHLRFHDIQLPVFELSYMVDQKFYTDQFALSMHAEPVDLLIGKMLGRKITVQYDPQNPGNCFIPAREIEGCKVEQRIGSLVRFYPKN